MSEGPGSAAAAVLGDRDRYWLAGSAVVITVVAQLADPGTATDLLIVAPALLVYVFQDRLRRLPIELVCAAVIAPLVLVVGLRAVLEPILFLSVMMILYMSARIESTVRAAVVTAVAAAMPWFVSDVLANEEIGWPAWTMAHLFTFALGRTVQRQQALIAALDRAREELAGQAVAEERRRIARELHDLAGHTLAAMLLHVTGARHVLRRDIDDAERALSDAERVGRASLDQIRATVAALRTDERGTDPALAGAAELAGLVEEYRRAGLAITASVDPLVADLVGPTGVALHRIAREALANVARHAPANAVELRVEVGDGDVRLLVTDRGRPAEPPDPDRSHFGLVGMSERARAVGGSLDAGATADGWRVEARLPTPGAPTVRPSEYAGLAGEELRSP